jgi:CBS domain-containing protein
MTFSSLIEEDYPVFALDDAAGEAARRLVERRVGLAPVIDGDRYAGMATLSGLLAGNRGWPSAKTAVRSSVLERVPVFGPDTELIEGLKAFVAIGSEAVPLADDDGTFAGIVTRRAVMEALAALFHAEDGSSSLEIEVPPPGARLSEMIAVIEKNDASIVSFSSKPSGKTGDGQLLLFRVMTHDFFRLVRNLEKYGYLVSYHSPFPDAGYDEMREKALEFIRYMDM